MNSETLSTLAQLSDHDLLARVKDLAQREREATVALILSEHAAYNRIETARAVRQFPALLEHLAAGWVTLSTVCRLAPHLTPENHRDVVAWRATGASAR